VAAATGPSSTVTAATPKSTTSAGATIHGATGAAAPSSGIDSGTEAPPDGSNFRVAVGVGVGVASGIGLILVFIGFLLVRRRRARRAAQPQSILHDPEDDILSTVADAKTEKDKAQPLDTNKGDILEDIGDKKLLDIKEKDSGDTESTLTSSTVSIRSEPLPSYMEAVAAEDEDQRKW
jgi:hypothetical protein